MKFALIILSFLLVNTGLLFSSDNVTIPNTFEPNTIISSQEMNENFSYLIQKLKELFASESSGGTGGELSQLPKYILTGNNASLIGSNDGQNWTDFKPPGSGLEFRKETFNSNEYYFSSKDPQSFYTTDFKTFHKIEVPLNESGVLLSHNNKYFILYMNNSKLYESVDLTNWTLRIRNDTYPTNARKCFIVNEKIICIVDQNGSEKKFIHTDLGSLSQWAMESLTLSNSMDSYNDAIVDLTYSNNFYFLAGSIRENNRYKSVIYRSSDLTTWQELHSVNNNNYNDGPKGIDVFGNLIILKGEYHLTTSSDGGVNWFTKPLSGGWNEPGSGSFKEQILVTYFNNFYYYASLLLDVVEQDNLGGSQSVTYNSTSRYAVLKSSNGQNWDIVFETNDQINDIESDNERLIVVGNSGLTSVSLDGNTWTTLRPSGQTLYSIIKTN